MSTQLEKSDFVLLDKADEEQIKNAGEAVKQALCYDLVKNGKKTRQITFIGLKWITLKMAQKGEALEVISSEVNLEKDEPDNKDNWFWRAKIKCRNQKNGLETEGVAECPYFEKGTYNKFGRTIAHSKAERNAWRKQIPELEITTLIDTAKGDQSQTLQSKSPTESPPKDEWCHCPDQNTVPDFVTNKCKTCGAIMSEYKITRLQSSG